jgi:hypothetical protein
MFLVPLTSFDAVREIGLTLADVVDGTTYGSPALKVRGRPVACVPVNKSAEPNSAVFWVGRDRRAMLIKQQPHIYYVTEHYEPYGTVLVRLSHIARDEIRELLLWAIGFVAASKHSLSVSRSGPNAKPLHRARAATAKSKTRRK